jgi:hypothetical protein
MRNNLCFNRQQSNQFNLNQTNPIHTMTNQIEGDLIKAKLGKRDSIYQNKTMYIMHAYVTKKIHAVNRAMSLSYKQVVDIPVRLLELCQF